MSKIDELLPDINHRALLRMVIEKEYSDCLNAILRIRATCDPDDINTGEMIEYYSLKCEQLKTIYLIIFAECMKVC